MEGEPANVTKRRKEFTDLIDAAKNKIEEADKLHTEVTKYRTTAVQRASIADSSVAHLPALVPENADIEGQDNENEDIVKMVKLRPSG